jgi:hypothetical protein
MAEQPKVEIFFADPVDEDGNVIGRATMGDVQTPWGPAKPVKIPYDEIVLEPGNTIRVELDEGA